MSMSKTENFSSLLDEYLPESELGNLLDGL